jgi:hypothetical protein
MTIATSKPKSSEIVADIPERLLSTLYGAGFPGFYVSMSREPFRDIKNRNLPTRLPGSPCMLLLFLYHAVIVPCLS